MELTEADVRAIAEKLRPFVAGFSDEEREVLNEVFGRALAFDDDVMGLAMQIGSAGAPPIKLAPSGGPTAPPGAPGGSSGAPSAPRGDSSGVRSYPSAPGQPAIKLF
jgi:hypothetical protein